MSSCPPGACVPFQGWSRSSPGSCVHSGSLFTSLGNRHSSAPARGNSLAAAGAAGAGSAAGAAGHLLPDPPAPRPSPGRVFANITNLMQLDLRTAGPVGCRNLCVVFGRPAFAAVNSLTANARWGEAWKWAGAIQV